jgi:hypothetical protein
MTTFADFVVELHDSDPSLDLSALEDAFDSISTEADPISLALYDAAQWAVNRTEYPVQVRLVFLARFWDRAAYDRPTLQCNDDCT